MKYLLLALVLTPGLVFADERFSEIQSFKETIPEKGYILSVDLHEKKMCSKIWTKQISEFKKNNPQIKNPDFILVHQKIKVQDCRRVKLKPKVYALKKATPPLAYESKEKIEESRPSWFFGIFGGMSFLGGKSDDTAKNGYNVGYKLGKNFFIGDNTLGLSVGYFRNFAETVKSNNPLGDYQTERSIFTLEMSSVQKLGSSFHLGPVFTVVAGKDISLREKEVNTRVGAYFGLASLFDLTKKFQLELNGEQRIDDTSRLNLLTNLGVRFNF